MSSTFSEKLQRNESDPPEPTPLPKPEVAKSSYDYEEQEDETMSDYNISDDEFTPSKRRKRKDASFKRVCFCMLKGIFVVEDSIGVLEHNTNFQNPLFFALKTLLDYFGPHKLR